VKHVNYAQTITFRAHDADALVALLTEWDANQAKADVMGYIGAHLLADRETPGRFVIVAEFAAVDPEVPAADEAARNNERPETQEWARKLLEHVEGEPEYRQFDELYRTD
jgi:hypothetical protein